MGSPASCSGLLSARTHAPDSDAPSRGPLRSHVLPAGPPPRMRRSYADRAARSWSPSFSASSAFDGSRRWVPSPKTIVGIVRPPPLDSSTKRRPASSRSMATHENGIRCSVRNAFEGR